jgi:hypothetical protein
MRLAIPLAILALALLVGCGSSEETTTSAPTQGEVNPGKVQSAFELEPDCKPPQGASRWGCSIGSYRCQGVVVDRGWSVSCTKPGESIAFLIRRG